MNTLFKDIRYGIRSLLKHPGFTAIVIVTLAIGIGASSAIFSVVNTVLLRPLPYARAERLVAIQEITQDGKRVQVTPANFLDWRAQNTVFEQLAAILTRPANLALADQAERIDLAMTSANFFSVFGMEPELGRFFINSDEQAGHAPVVVVSHALWQRRFGGDASLVGKPITLDGNSYTVVGIAPAGFQYPDKTDVWVPPFKLAPTVNERMDPTQVRGFGMLAAVALLRPGVPLAQAASEMQTITARLRQQYPDSNNRRFNRVVSLHTHLVGETGPMLLLLFGAVSFVLLIACANVANLLLASAATRQKEMAIRTALGASRLRVIRQLLTENLMLAFAGGATGLLLALWGVALMTKLLPRDFPRLGEINLDWRVLAFTLFASVLTGILFGLAPALQISRTDVQESLKESGRGASSGRRHNRLRNLLIVGEVALSVVLLVGAGLLFRSFLQLQSVNTGFTSEQVLTLRLSPAGSTYRLDADYISFYSQAVQRVAAIPGVEAVGAINTLPLDKGPTAGFRIEGRPLLTPDKWPGGNYRTVSTDYFHAMNIPVVQGRGFNERDTETAPLVMIVNQALAKRDFPNENPVGKRINLGNLDPKGQPVWFEIVGVAANVRSLELREEATPEFYLSALQDSFTNMFLVVRTSVEPTSVAASVRRAAAEVDKSAAVSDIKTMEHIVSDAVTQPRFNLFLLGLFSAIALLLSAAGIYGVTAYSVTQRTHEFGIRMALGAQVGDVLKMILRQGMLLISIGIAVGLLASFALTRLLRTLLFGVTVTDPLTFVAITLLLTVVALLACYIPARRATKVDPLTALRYE
ncbi:MAG TPA: ABC transporter permease [Pyrinomonadaceae bacterium]|jgi:putative ABC transport system permease protein|nr:ABC transporter permease [Pyrinomonadaceae bacterium]